MALKHIKTKYSVSVIYHILLPLVPVPVLLFLFIHTLHLQLFFGYSVKKTQLLYYYTNSSLKK